MPRRGRSRSSRRRQRRRGHGGRGGGGGGGLQIPPPSQYAQYLRKNPCSGFNAFAFNQSLANGRITIAEVAETVEHVHASVNNFRNNKICCAVCCIVSILSTLIYLASTTGGPNNTNSLSVMYVSFFCCLCSTCACMFGLQKISQDNTAKMKLVLEQENINKWHARGIHWSIWEGIAIKIDFTWDNEKGMCVPPPDQNQIAIQMSQVNTAQLQTMQQMQAQMMQGVVQGQPVMPIQPMPGMQMNYGNNIPVHSETQQQQQVTKENVKLR